ncbi:MAG TPA: glycosyltransferase, partial [Patescibacteria group bacterium]
MINRKTILVLATTFPRWENDTTPPFVYELEKRLAQDFDIAVLVPHYPGSRLTESWQNLSVHRFRYFWPEKLQQLCYDGGIFPNIKKNKWLLLEVPFLLISEFIAAAVIIKEQKTSLIHAHWIIPQGIIALLLNRLFLTPYIITTHGTDVYGMQN